MSIKVKIVIILTALITFASISLFDKWQQYEQVSLTRPLYALAADINGLVFELQRERGLSSGFIGSKGEAFSEALKSQRQSTDERLRSLEQNLTTAGAIVTEGKLAGELRALTSELNRLNTVRSGVDSLVPGVDAFHYYSSANAQCLRIIELMAVMIHDVELAQLIKAYSILLQVQESAGQERAAINAMLASGKLDVTSLEYITGIVFEQQELTGEFFHVAPAKYVGTLRQLLRDPLSEEVERFRQAVVNKGLRDELLNEIHTLIGYGGLVHTFKNYVLRGRETYATRFNQTFGQARAALSRFRQIPGLSGREYDDIDVIENTFEQYQRNLAVVRSMLAEGATISAIDYAVMVDDEPALRAITHLREDIVQLDSAEWFNVATQRIDRLQALNDSIQSDITLLANDLERSITQATLIYFIAFSAALVGLLFLVAMLFKRVVGAVLKMARAMEEMRASNKYTQVLDVRGRDEIADLALAFNALINERNKAELVLAEKAGELERSNIDLEQFSYGVSHDLQAPLNSLTGFIGLLKLKYQDAIPSEALEYLNLAEQGAENMSSLIRDLLEFSRVTTEKKQFTSVDMNTVLSRAVANLKVPIDETGAEIDSASLPTISGDATQLMRLMQNLVGNALKYRHPDRAPRLRITVERDGAFWLFSVHDNGLGIAPQHIERIFGMFQRIHDDGKGTGVGLALCQRIVQLHGGSIRVESSEGEGSCFMFTLLVKPDGNEQ